jgi:signal transduction histidine kinase/HD-like signal output (HDOD) protein
MPDQLREKRVELILQQLEELPTLPPVVIKVLQTVASDETSARQVIELISSDQSLTTRILQLLHRAETGVADDINSVDRAVVLLGFEAVRSMVLAVSVFHTMGLRPAASRAAAHFNREEFWKHSIAVACCAELLAEKLQDIAKDPALSPSEAFVCGLLHDLGKVALDTVLPKSFDRVVEAADLLRSNIADLERSIIGLDHMVVGKRLAERWELPATLRECIWLHGQLPAALPATVKNPRMVNLITIADRLVREQHLGYSGNYTFAVPKSALIAALGLTDAMLEQATTELVTRIEPRAEGLGLGQLSSDELYLQALTQANKQLGQITTQLAAKNKRLAVRAKFFDALSHFQNELRPDSPPQLVLQAIGQTAVGVLDVSSASAFSVSPGQNFAETLLFDHQGDVFQHSVIECPTSIPMPIGGDGPVMAVGQELEWLLANISPRLADDHRYWIGLEADGKCIGGIVWGAKTGEAPRLAPQVQELTALAVGWSLALRTAQIRDESRTLAEQLADANRRLQSAQEEIQRSKTIITVGEMAAGAAHEMNNPLAVISGRSQLLLGQLTDPKQKHAANLIHEQSHRLSEIITELMDFAKPVPPQPVEVDLAELIERAFHEAKLLTDPADRCIEVTITAVPPVVVDEKQVTAAMIEVISNAIQATDEKKGHVTLHAAYDPHSGKVVISINDNGSGMDEETLRRAFDPFFSSKPAGRRRGLGLAKTLRWIEASGGSIRLESRVDHGTRSIILLPVAAVDASDASPTARAAEG